MENQPVVLGGVDTRSSGGVVLPEGVSAARLDEEGRIAIDLDCIGCQYNLRMCDAQGRCPECGLAVGRSAVGRYLCYHEPKWVQCLAWGMNRFAVALLAVGVTALLGFAWSVIGDEMPSNRRPFWPVILIYGFLPPVAIGFGLLGLARATWPDPSPVGAERWLSARRLARGLLVVGCVLPFAAAGVMALDVYGSPYGEPGWVTAIATLVVVLVWLGVPVFLLIHARKLAVMIPRLWLARWTLIVLLLIAASGVLIIGLSDNWFGWCDWAVLGYERIWPTYTGTGPYAAPGPYGYYGWTPGDPWYFHDEFSIFLERIQGWSWIGLGLCVLGIVPLFFVYWSALHKEAAKAKATWAASPWRGTGVGETAAESPAG